MQEQADPLAFLIRVMNGDNIDGQTPTITERMTAARDLRRVIVPDAKETPVAIALPAVDGPADLPAAFRVILSAVAAGDIMPGEAKAVADLLESARKAYVVADLAERIAVLEGRA